MGDRHDRRALTNQKMQCQLTLDIVHRAILGIDGVRGAVERPDDDPSFDSCCAWHAPNGTWCRGAMHSLVIDTPS